MSRRGRDAAGQGRIVIQNGEYWMVNKGDLAMLDVTVHRLRERLPGVRVGVLTSAPLLLRAFAPEAEPLAGKGGHRPRLPTVTHWPALAPAVAGPPQLAALNANNLRRRYTVRIADRLRTRAPQPVRADRGVPAERHLEGAAMLLAMGGGYLTDADPEQTHRTLALLASAVDRGIPTALVGQGLGPLTDRALLDRASAVLPEVDLIALRERRSGPQLLARLGVPADRVLVTGDDAIELAAGQQRSALGADLGVCLRIAEYSPVDAGTRRAVKVAVQEVAGQRGAALRPLIVSEYRSEDRRSTLPLVVGYDPVRPVQPRYVGPRRVAAAVAGCRVVVTGAYHLAVFALAQGIPVVGLSSSTYYDDKLLGLRDMFGGGLALQRLDDPKLTAHLIEEIDRAWATAATQREDLRASARAQIATSRAAYDRVAALMTRSVAQA